MSEQALPAVARSSITAKLEGARYTPPALPAPWAASRPVFVTLRTADGGLRGCIGHLAPTCRTLADEVADTAVSAATQDPRFPPVTREELDGLSLEISVLSEPLPVSGPEALDPSRFGVVVTYRRKRGVLLPDLEGVDTVADQLRIACRKAGISPGSPYAIARFEVLKIVEAS